MLAGPVGVQRHVLLRVQPDALVADGSTHQLIWGEGHPPG